MRRWLAVMVFPLLAGCLGGEARPDVTLESFRAVVVEGGRTWEVTLAGPSLHLDRDGMDRLGYRLDVASINSEGNADFVATAILDATGHVMRRSGLCHQEYTPDNVHCGATWSAWEHRGTLPLLGVGWGFIARSDAGSSLAGEASVVKRWSESTLVVEGQDEWSRLTQYEFEGDAAMPVRAYRVHAFGERELIWERASYERLGPLEPADVWPDSPIKGAAFGNTAGFPLFPGADTDPGGFGFTAAQAFEELLAKSDDARTRMETGCVVGIDVRPAEGPGVSLPLGYAERVATATFAIQDEQLAVQAYAVDWLEYATGANGFDILPRDADWTDGQESSHRTCDARKADPWPEYSLADFVTLLERIHASPLDGYRISHFEAGFPEKQPERLNFQNVYRLGGASVVVDGQTGWIADLWLPMGQDFETAPERQA